MKSNQWQQRASTGRRAATVLSFAILAAVVPGGQPASAETTGETLLMTGESTLGLMGGSAWGLTAEAESVTTVKDAADAVRSTRLLREGLTGQGVGVALIDTGVVSVPGLRSGNVVNGPDLSFESQSPDSSHLDTFGHGTHMAGIIAGRDQEGRRGFQGIAPDSTLVSVKVGVHDGAVDVSQVIAAVDWVVQNKSTHNVRVLNLAYGTDGAQPYTSDPLAHAVENAWRSGIVVVVSGGNRGSGQARVDNPASDPYVLAVGANDTMGTTNPDDDVVPEWSTRGGPERSVDVVAPGKSIVSLRNPGSYIDVNHPSALVDERFFKGTGTSQAAAVVSGSVALLLEQRPEMTPDQVKKLLMSTAKRLPNADAAGQGAGLINVLAAARTATPDYTQTWPPSTGLGSLEAARGGAHVSDAGVDLVGEQDIFGRKWRPRVWAPLSTAGTAWNRGVWNGSAWTGDGWDGQSWTASTWSGRTWNGRTWNGDSWSGRTWNGRTWNGEEWSGRTWNGRTWNGRTWNGGYWSSGLP